MAENCVKPRQVGRHRQRDPAGPPNGASRVFKPRRHHGELLGGWNQCGWRSNHSCGWRIVISARIRWDFPSCYDSVMQGLVVLLVHFITSLARLLGPGGARSLIAESLLLKHQLLILNRSRQRAPNLSASDRILARWLALWLRPTRLLRSAIVLKPSTLMALHQTMQAKVPRAVLTQSPSQARPKRTECGTHQRGRGNEATEFSLGVRVSLNRSLWPPQMEIEKWRRRNPRVSRRNSQRRNKTYFRTSKMDRSLKLIRSAATQFCGG